MRNGIKSICLLMLMLTVGTLQAQSVVVIPLMGDDAKNLKNVITVAKANGDFSNPVSAIDSIPTSGPDIPSATNRYLIVIGPGEYNIGKLGIVMKEWVSIQGSGREATRITGGISTDTPDESSAIVVGASNASLTDLCIENTGGNEYSFAIYNIYASASPRIERVNAHAEGGSASNMGVRSREGASPDMMDVIATATGGLDAYGLYFDKSSSRLINVIASGTGGRLDNRGITIFYPSTSSPELNMTNIQATATGGTSSYGVSIRLAASPTMTNLTARGVDSTGNNYGVYIENSSPYIQGSIIVGTTTGLWFNAGSKATRVVNSLISSVSDGAPRSRQCRENFNGNLTDVDC